MIYFIYFDEVNDGFDTKQLVPLMQSFHASVMFSDVAWMITSHEDMREICRRLASFTRSKCGVIVTEIGAVATYERKENTVFDWVQNNRWVKY